MGKMEKSKKEKKIPTTFQDDDQRKISEIITLIDELFRFRFVEKVSRPISNTERQIFIEQYKNKIDFLHQKMEKLKLDSQKESQTHSATKEKSGKSTKATKPFNRKYQFKKIATKYNEVLIEGSFKHYEKVCKVYNLPSNIKPLDCYGWSEQSVSKAKHHDEEKCCC